MQAYLYGQDTLAWQIDKKQFNNIPILHLGDAADQAQQPQAAAHPAERDPGRIADRPDPGLRR